MHAGAPDPEEAPPHRPSLIEGARNAIGARLADGQAPPLGGASWRKAAAIAALIAMGPVLTIGGAQLLTARSRADSARLEVQLKPLAAARSKGDAARAQMAGALHRLPLGTTLEAVARALPADATLVRAAGQLDGTIELDVATPDPDRLRAALRELGGAGRLRNVGQRQGDAGMIVSFRSDPQ